LYLAVEQVWGTNLWLNYVVPPFTCVLGLWAMAARHPHSFGKTAIRTAAPLQLIISVVLILTIEDPNNFSLVVGPLGALLLLLAASWTFLSLGLADTGGLARRDWFWIVAGVMLYAATTTALEPVSWYLRFAGRFDLLAAVYYARAGVNILAFLAVAGGLLCPIPPTSSGGSSSPPFSLLGSSSGPSAS
jgi:hypothetical protein